MALLECPHQSVTPKNIQLAIALYFDLYDIRNFTGFKSEGL